MITPNLNNNKGLNRNRSVVNTNNINKGNPTQIRDSKINNINDEINSKKLKSSKTKDRQEQLNEIQMKNNK